MWKKLLRTTLIAALVLSSCTDNDVYKGPKEDEKEFNNFPFSTVQKDVNLNVNYVNGTVQSNVYFEVLSVPAGNLCAGSKVASHNLAYRSLS